ncbi:DUF4179 domain-containing protein [Paenibacillus wulumuqiensis]|uniref:DUF4179 domain-containing protein n=1 Tax=Paenibacillus wulumuqiensis TaxID=1567107 RepID=UPI000619B345|nr:DUF4179 domain-containing protein [Paenibacillus wulumuqiensis]
MKNDKLDQWLRSGAEQEENDLIPPDIQSRLQLVYDAIEQGQTGQGIREKLSRDPQEEQAAVVPDTMAAQPVAKRKPRRMLRHGMTAAAMLIGMGGILGSGYFSADMAHILKQVPGVPAVYQLTSHLGWTTADEQESESDSLSIEQQGVTMTIEKIVYDGRKVYLEMKQQHDAQRQSIQDVEIYINGKSAASAKEQQSAVPPQNQSEHADQYRLHLNLNPSVLFGLPDGIVSSDPSEIQLSQMPAQLDMQIRVSLKKAPNSPFVYNVNVQKQPQTASYILKKKASLPEKLVVRTVEVEVTPATTYIDMNIERIESWRRKHEGSGVYFILMDSLNRPYHPFLTSGDPATPHMEYNSLPDDAGDLTLVPYTFNLEPIMKKYPVPIQKEPSDAHPIELDMGTTGKVKIMERTSTDNEITLRIQPGEAYQAYMVAYSLWYGDQKMHEARGRPAEIFPDPAHAGQYLITYDKTRLKPGDRLCYYVSNMRYLKEIPLTRVTK